MTSFDVFNGDADGICALQQLRLAAPRESTLITGVKRDIALLRRVSATAGDEITVLDISLDKNRDALNALLEGGARIEYFDHHFAGDIPVHENLRAHIDPSADLGTSLLVDAALDGRFRAWAVVGTYGDNFERRAAAAAEPLELAAGDLSLLRELGIYINYNGYGATPEDLYYAPDVLYRYIQPYTDPLDFIRDDATFRRLKEGYLDDMERARRVVHERQTTAHAVYVFPAEPWARRVSGVYANELAREAPHRAHALLTRLPKGGFVVSVRAPLNDRQGADDLCRQFPGGGGRKAAAGINHLADEMFDPFAARFAEQYATPAW